MRGLEADLEKTVESLDAILRAHEQRHHCEVLYARGRVNDAVESLKDIMNAESDAVRADKLIANWLPQFTRQCVAELEKTGDEALQIRRHGEAIAAYSAALSLRHPTPHIVLAKWASTVLMRDLPSGALAASVRFNLPGFTTFRTICNVLEGNGRVTEAIACYRRMQNELEGDNSSLDGERAQWQHEFLLRCAERLQKLGDIAMDSQDYSEAAGHFSTILSLDATCRNHSPASTALIKWARSMIRVCGSANELLATAIKFKLTKFVIFCAICDALEGQGNAMGAIAYFRRMKKELECDASFHDDERARWELGFLQRCAKQLEQLGDSAAESQSYEEAAVHFSAILTLNPENRVEVLIKRSNARALAGSWEEALRDADEITKLDPSCHQGYEVKHAALHGMKCYAAAVEAFDTMLSKIEESPDVNIRKIRERYVDARPIIRRVVQQTIRRIPRILIDTTTGRLCNKERQAAAFEELPVYSELISSLTTQLDYTRILETVTECYQYVMLSHEWEDEALLQDVEGSPIYNLKASPTNAKLGCFCLLVRSLGFRWAWSYNSCMDMPNATVMRESLVATFAWFRGSSLTIVHLRDTPSVAFSRTQTWPYPEYIAAQTIRFYTKDWEYFGSTVSNHKESPNITPGMENATGVPTQEIGLLSPGLDNVREKLHLASMDRRMPIEDAAYTLLRIFNLTIPIRYGEEDRAVGRVLERILTSSGDATILAWTGSPGSYNSCLPVDFTVYGSPAPPHVPLSIEEAEMDHIVTGLCSSLADISVATTLHKCLMELPSPTLYASRLRLPCIVFPLTNLKVVHSTEPPTVHVYRATTPALGVVKIDTADDLTGMQGLCLVHPWIHPLLDRHSSHDRDTLDDVTRALRCVARIRQPFGALLFASMSYVGYIRVATDSLIMVQIREEVPLAELISCIHMIEVI